MINKLNQAVAFQEKAIGLRAYRQQILASNIANADTPNYKARDIDFSAALQNAMAGRSGGVEMTRTSTRHLSGSEGGGPASLLYRKETQSAVDGNTVDMDVERSMFAENAIRYEASLTFLGGRFKTLLSSIQGN